MGDVGGDGLHRGGVGIDRGAVGSFQRREDRVLVEEEPRAVVVGLDHEVERLPSQGGPEVEGRHVADRVTDQLERPDEGVAIPAGAGDLHGARGSLLLVPGPGL